jgi:hypothetical protein
MRSLVGGVLVLMASVASPVTAQVNQQISGIVESVGDHELTLRTAGPPRRVYGAGANPAPAPRPTLLVNLEEVPASQWVFLRPGERIAVVGLPSADGLRFAAIAIIGGAGPPRRPEAP